MKLIILIPCYNTHKYLNDLIPLLRSQTHSKIIIIDDGSSPSINIESFEPNPVIANIPEIIPAAAQATEIGTPLFTPFIVARTTLKINSFEKSRTINK